MITPSDLRLRYSEFYDQEEYTDDKIQLYIDDAVDDIGEDETHWGTLTRYDRALSALTAHLLVLGSNSEYGDINPYQPIMAKKAGDVEVTHRSTKAVNQTIYQERLSSTTYGQDFLAIRKRSFVGVIVTPGWSE